jgi:hypothetical protein
MSAIATPTTAGVTSAYRSIMGTVAITANSATALINTVSKSVTMLDAFVSNASDEQRAKQEARREDFVNNLIRTSAQQQAEANIQAVEFCNQSKAHAEQYESAHDRYSALLNKYRPSVD